jgi:hypothetical protein
MSDTIDSGGLSGVGNVAAGMDVAVEETNLIGLKLEIVELDFESRRYDDIRATPTFPIHEDDCLCAGDAPEAKP